MAGKESFFKRVKLQECATFQEGYVNPSQGVAEYFGNDVKWLRAVDLNDSFVWETSRRLSKSGYESAGKASLLFEPDTLAISKSGTIGRLGILKDFMCGNRAVINIKTDRTKYDTRFIFYSLLIRRREIEGRAVGSVQPNLYCSALGDIEIEAPPLAEQRAIAQILGVLDDKIELNRRMNATLEAMARALFQSWFVDFDPVRAKLDGRKPAGLDAATARLFPASFQESSLGAVPEGWRHISLREIADIFSGGTPKKTIPAYWSGTIPWISPKTMMGIHVDDSDDHVSEAAVGNGTRLVPKGTVFVMVRGMGLHQGVRISQAQSDLTFNQDVKALVSKEVDSTFLLFAILNASPYLFSKVQASGHGTGVLPTDILESLNFVVPPPEIGHELSQPLAFLNLKIATNERESRTLAALRDTLLPKLLSGELRVPDAERLVGRAT